MLSLYQIGHLVRLEGIGQFHLEGCRCSPKPKEVRLEYQRRVFQILHHSRHLGW